MTRIRSHVWRSVVAILLAATLLPGVATAQNPAAPTPGPTAHVRFWKTELREFPSVRTTLKVTSGRHLATHELGGGKPGYQFNEYAEVPAGRGTLEVFSGAEAHPLVSLPADLAPGAFTTVLLREPEKSGNPPRLEIIDDGSVMADAAPSQITVRNLIVSLKDMHLTMGEILSVQFVSGDSFLQMRGLKSQLYPLRTVGTSVDGVPFDWNLDIDLRQNHHQTLLIYPDPYGRIRPRLVVDGANQADAPPPVNKDQQR